MSGCIAYTACSPVCRMTILRRSMHSMVTLRVCRVAWALYGVIVTQLGDFKDRDIELRDGTKKNVPQYLEDVFNYKCDIVVPSHS